MAKIPTILEPGRADGILIKIDSIYDNNKKIFLSDELENIDNNHNTLNDKINSLTNIINNNKSNIETKLETEQIRATNAESALDVKIETEKNRAIEKEDNLIETINNITKVNENSTSANIVTIDPLSNSTASNVQQALNPLYENSLYAGIATPKTNPGTPNNKIFYIATKAGIYTNFSNIEVIEGETVILQWNNNEWTKNITGLATKQKVTTHINQLNEKIFNFDTQDWEIKKVLNITPNTAANIISYLGFGNSTFVIEGNLASAFQIIGTNKATGNVISLYQQLTPIDFPITFNNPRPDLELINITWKGMTATAADEVTITITKESKIKKHSESLDLIKEKQIVFDKLEKIETFDAIFSTENLIIRKDGTYAESPNYLSTTPIFLHRCDSITFTKSAPPSVAMLSESTYNGIFVRTLIVGENAIKERTYIAEKDMYVRICCGQTTISATINRSYPRYYTESNIQNKFEYNQLTAGSITKPYKIIKGHSYKVTNTSSTSGVAMNLRSRNSLTGENIDDIATGLESSTKNNYVIYTAINDADYIWSYINKAGSYSIEDISSIEFRINELEKKPIIKSSQVRFDFEKSFKDMSDIFAEFNFTNKMYQEDILEQIDAKFLSLLYSYPDLIRKYDAVTLANSTGLQLEYPIYANGIKTEGTYKITPAYKTYLWKISATDKKLTGDGYTPKKKIFLIGGVHGNEKFAMYNLYAFAKLLVNCSDSNYYKLLASCDFYILPCLNGYGAYHTMRGNANNVNINRNYPTWLWNKNDPNASSRYNDLACDYTGDYAGSEFETQLIIGCVKCISPDLVIDHHNYGEESSVQFYTHFGTNEDRILTNQCAIDVWQKLTENLPQYFGKGYGDNSVSILPSTVQTTSQWMTENGITSYTIEISHCIHYNNGDIIEDRNNKESFTSNVANIAEYTLRQQLLVYIDDIMKK